MPKKQQLEKIVRGKGLEALRPTPEHSPAEGSSSQQSEAEKTKFEPSNHFEQPEAAAASDELSEEATGEMKRLNKYCIITPITPTIEQQSYIQAQLSDDSHQILIWDLFIAQNGKIGSAFQPGIPASFNICCTASGLIAQLKPEIDIYWVSYDLLRMQIQPSYKLVASTKPWWNNFKIQFEIVPDITGFFNFHVIVDLKAASFFWMKEGFMFKIIDNN